jgi:two-component system LytT family response regulator
MLIDDEIDACKNLSALLQLYWADKINIFGIAQSTSDAERMMGQMQPDVIFIDIEMPGENAFQFLERISPVDFEIIFVTAYDEYALRALKLNAIDYILKPISLEELEGAIKKLEEKILYKEVAKNYFLSENFATLNSQLNGKTDNIHSIVLKNLTRTHVVNFDDVLYLEAQGNYVNFNFRIGEEYISTMSFPKKT